MEWKVSYGLPLSGPEIALLHRLSQKNGYKVVQIGRRSDREFDLNIEGTDDLCRFSAWAVLSGINSIDYWRQEIAAMTDYPDMTRSGDWSGVRDTDESKQWEIFHKFVVPLL